MIQPLSKSSPGYQKISQAFDAGEKGKKWIASQLRLSGDHGAAAQLKVALTIQAIADDRNGGPNGIPSLGDTITAQRQRKKRNLPPFAGHSLPSERLRRPRLRRMTPTQP